MKHKSLINSRRKPKSSNKEKLNKSKRKNNCLYLNLYFRKIVKICNIAMRRKYIQYFVTLII